jgi:hypothetical protein
MSNNIELKNVTLASNIRVSNKIIMYAGYNLPNGYVWCDGNNGTPDMRDRFIYGISSSDSNGNLGNSEINYIPIHNHAINAPTTTMERDTAASIPYKRLDGETVVSSPSNSSADTNPQKGGDDSTASSNHVHAVRNVNSINKSLLNDQCDFQIANTPTGSFSSNNFVGATGTTSNIFDQKYIYIGFIMKL